MNITHDEKKLISAMDITESLYNVVKEKGMVSLREYGVKKVLEGVTTYREVMENTYATF